MEKNTYHEINQYKDALFPVEIYHVDETGIFPSGRGLEDLHWHDELQFTLAVHGSFTLQANARQYRIKEGEAAFINSGIIHTVTNLSKGGHYTSLNFPYKLLSFFPGSRMEKEQVLPYTSGGSCPVLLFRPQVPWQKTVLDLLKELNTLWNDTTNKHMEYLISLKILSLWYTMLSHLPEEMTPASSTDLIRRQRLQSMLSFIYEHFAEDISLTDIAACSHISTGECCRIFREHLQTTPYQFLTEYRIRKSVELLSGEHSISEIAARCGYNQVSNYISKFKSILKVTPAQYRKHKKLPPTM